MAEAALLDIWHKFAANAAADPAKARELLLSTGKLVMKENKFYFVPKPIQADTVPGKDCLALTKTFQEDLGGSGTRAKSLAGGAHGRPATSASAGTVLCWCCFLV